MAEAKRLTNMTNSVTCRLPQTPRTPSVGMAHYFDDIFHRTLDVGAPRPSEVRRHLRRSSTARSIGARSDFDISLNGGDDDNDDARSMTNSVFHDNLQKSREKEEADLHLHQYISDQLNRYKDGTLNGQNHEDEFETKA